jgi:hypothetical protein
MAGRPRRFALIPIATLVALLGLLPGEVSLARLTDAATATQSLGTDTLDPPTALAATGGANAALSWSATVDTYASGYELQRATASGGPYTVVASITPRTTVATTDTPSSSGTYYYVLRSVFQSWTSVNSNQASATVNLGATPTGYKTCTIGSNAPDTGGNGNGYELLPSNACGDDLLSASDVNSNTNTTVSCTNPGKDRHRFWDFTLGVPASVSSVNGIQVRFDEGMNNNGGTSQICVELSWDAGTTWTTPKAQSLTGGSAITTYTLGAANDTWGRTWTGANFSNANFRVRLTDVTSQPNKTFFLEYLAVQVTYTP